MALIPHNERVSYALPHDVINKAQRAHSPFKNIEQEVTYYRTYSAKIGDRNEVWWETCRRVIEGCWSIYLWHWQQHPKNMPSIALVHRLAEQMFWAMFHLQWVPAGRGLQHMGREVMWEKGSAVLNNCGFISTASMHENGLAHPFDFLMDMSMLGVGVGLDTEGEGYPVQCPSLFADGFVVTDTREGWVELLVTFLNAFDGKGKLPTAYSFFDVRKYGADLRLMGGKASGPTPLARMIVEMLWVLVPNHRFIASVTDEEGRVGIINSEIKPWDFWPQFKNVQTLLISAIDGFETYKITDNQIADLANIVGKCVVSGGIRRSAEIVLGKFGSKAFRDRKRNDQLRDAWRWCSNNSAVMDSFLAPSQCNTIGSEVGDFGDIGIFWRGVTKKMGRTGEDRADPNVVGCNPCGEQPEDPDELCNLGETAPFNCNTLDEWGVSALCTYYYCKAVSLLPVHRAATQEVINRNRRMGISMTGILPALEKFGAKAFWAKCDEVYRLLRTTDRLWSADLEVNESIRLTSLKPSGTVSLVLGVPSGMLPDKAEYSIRRIRLENTSPLIRILADHGYHCEPDLAAPATTVVEFLVRASSSKTSATFSMVEQLDLVEDIQRYWSDNMVSNTIGFKAHEQKHIGPEIFRRQGRVKSLAFLALEDHKYKQAPYEAISRATYESKAANLVSFSLAEALPFYVHENDERFCEGASCQISQVMVPA
jgi:ribonucleoside-triphosphate reductase (thioredoxin)